MTKAAPALLRKLLFARILQWVFLAIAILPTSIVLLRLIDLASRSPSNWGEVFGIGLVIHFCWPVPFFALLGFCLALEWKQGLRERVEKQEGADKNLA
jgi:hypothetical protein